MCHKIYFNVTTATSDVRPASWDWKPVLFAESASNSKQKWFPMKIWLKCSLSFVTLKNLRYFCKMKNCQNFLNALTAEKFLPENLCIHFGEKSTFVQKSALIKCWWNWPQLVKRCRFAYYGCEELIKDLNEHEEDCSYRIAMCLFFDCDRDIIPMHAYLQHFKEEHVNTLAMPEENSEEKWSKNFGCLNIPRIMGEQRVWTVHEFFIRCQFHQHFTINFCANIFVTKNCKVKTYSNQRKAVWSTFVQKIQA